MRVNWFEIFNFRSIINSGKCYLNSNISVLAGKNESGKSNILKALECFSDDDFEGNEPQDNSSENPKVNISFNVSGEELEEYFDIENAIEANFELIISRSAEDPLGCSGTAFDLLAEGYIEDKSRIKEDLVKKVKSLAKATQKKTSVRTHNISFPVLARIATKYISEINSTLSELDPGIHNEVQSLIGEANSCIEEGQNLYDSIKDIKDQLNDMAPRFVLFDSFEDILPEHVTLEEIKDKKIIERFFKVANIDATKIFSEKNGQKRRQATDSTSAEISGDFANYYKQETVKLKIDLDGPKLHFYIYDEEDVIPFKPSQRSKGLQWFISFYLTLNAERDDDCILLVDEPGLYLHAKAQEDVLHVLEDISKNQQVIFTTHSPYLIDPNRLERIKLVLKDKKKRTKIENKVHKGADKDTMTPIITAIGLDLTCGLTFSPNNNILLEGMSDYYYLQAMRKFLGDNCDLDGDTQMIPNVGANQIPNIAALLFGWDINFKVLLDNDSKGNSVANKLLKELCLEKEKVILLNSGKNHSIEDVFSKVDFYKHILDEEFKETDDSNSRIAKKLDKVLIAKRFCSKIHSDDSELKFEKETIDNFTKIFEQLAN